MSRSPSGRRHPGAGSSRGSGADTAVADIVRPPLAAAGYDLESVHVRRAGNQSVLEIAVDRDGGVDLDAVAEASTLLSAVLDEADDRLPGPLRGAYTLEVSSRGAAAPLTAPRHWRRAVGRLVEARGPAGVRTGRIVAADDEGAELQTDDGLVRLAYADVGTARVQLEFRRADRSDDPQDEEDR